MAYCRFNIESYFWDAQVCLVHPYEWTESHKCIYVCLNTCKKIKFITNFIFEILLLTVFNHLGQTWTHPIEMTEQTSMDHQLHAKELNSFLTRSWFNIWHNFEPSQAHLTTPTLNDGVFCCFNGCLPCTKIKLQTSTCLWDIVV